MAQFGNEIPLAQLGTSLRCQRDKEFAKIVRQEVRGNNVTLFFKCPKCGNQFRNNYTSDQYVKMADMALIDPPEIVDFQRKTLLETGKFVHIDKGLQGAFMVDDRKWAMIKKVGASLMCKCNKFYSVTVKKFEKDKVEFTIYCPECTPKYKGMKIKLEEIIPAGRAGLFDPSLMSSIMEEYRENAKQYDSATTYRGNDGTLSTWAQEQLGMAGDTPARKCYVCGTPIPEGAVRCSKCGSDVDLG